MDCDTTTADQMEALCKSDVRFVVQGWQQYTESADSFDTCISRHMPALQNFPYSQAEPDQGCHVVLPTKLACFRYDPATQPLTIPVNAFPHRCPSMSSCHMLPTQPVPATLNVEAPCPAEKCSKNRARKNSCGNLRGYLTTSEELP